MAVSSMPHRCTVVKNLPATAGNMGSIPGSGRSPEVGNGNLLQYSYLENCMDRGAWQATVHGVTAGHDLVRALMHKCLEEDNERVDWFRRNDCNKTFY